MGLHDHGDADEVSHPKTAAPIQAQDIPDGLALSIRDRNGNKMTFEYNDPSSARRVTKIIDSINRETTIDYSPGGCSGMSSPAASSLPRRTWPASYAVI